MLTTRHRPLTLGDVEIQEILCYSLCAILAAGGKGSVPFASHWYCQIILSLYSLKL